ncbi:MAG: DUF1489 family protein [Caulobacteraceae bacterium]|nr:DUF1489 domain-containing protein [Caulobacter sp.]RYF92951.1 MAG: DUF1489 family protein [Caulobacteraceae bacterium]
MPLHIIKLCVGVESLQDLRDWRAQRAAQGHPSYCPTRMAPKRAAEILEGGSLYWVIKGSILARQTITEIRTGLPGHQPVRFMLHPDLIETAPQPRRPFQGWRYLDHADVPPDLATGAGEAMDQDLAKQLRELGAW